ncbi:hypothetical protein J4H86_16345 [Spiractinospora alimapuensis]|uniref:DUF6412 domain-containing protein n=1 Tax=Spiractinospora alimapuensis TaxID=2820884 RepID=UPI001F399D33|nr:DUF6412 domain-containing protein [Spiractinospora alimapuensis]QVQ50481.1 hypothetical protein J4H86_16345 [Spiractinospora alimapuensis]
MHFVIALLEFLYLGTLPFEFSAAAPGTPGMSGAFALLAVTAAAFLALRLVRGFSSWPAGDAAPDAVRAMRRKSERLQVVPLRAPDTPGRPRPRAPGAALVAAR